jgi:methylated-DNA-[protein]-cysteine S-methyltransferase
VKRHIFECKDSSKSMQGIAYVNSPVGWLRIRAHEDVVVEVEYVDAPGEDELSTPVVEQALRELEEYFAGSRTEFTVRVAARGTLFQQTVWQLLNGIRFGRTESYLSLARKLGNAGAIRAIGQANHYNPIAIIVPCHRVVGADRTLVGYAGGLWRKRWLLEHERGVKEGTRTIPLTQFY